MVWVMGIVLGVEAAAFVRFARAGAGSQGNGIARGLHLLWAPCLCRGCAVVRSLHIARSLCPWGGAIAFRGVQCAVRWR